MSLQKEIFTYFQAKEVAQPFLYELYLKNESKSEALENSYNNCETFSHYLHQGQVLFQEAKQVNPMVQPLLLFYGWCHFLKACILTVRPEYPESTKHLAHGVSSRKKKKQDYRFLYDDIRIQQDGLFPYFAKYITRIDPSRFPTKITMHSLLSQLPELKTLFDWLGDEQLLLIKTTAHSHMTFPARLFDAHYVTISNMLAQLRKQLPPFHVVSNKNDLIIALEEEPFAWHRPFILSNAGDALYYPMESSGTSLMSKELIYYLLLYNLSMIARYESQWWGELFSNKADEDFPLISTFLETVLTHAEDIIAKFLLTKKQLSDDL